MKDSALSVKKRKDPLTEWEHDAVRLSVATEEGMSSGEPSGLDEVKDAQTNLLAKATKRPFSPTKAG